MHGHLHVVQPPDDVSSDRARLSPPGIDIMETYEKNDHQRLPKPESTAAEKCVGSDRRKGVESERAPADNHSKKALGETAPDRNRLCGFANHAEQQTHSEPCVTAQRLEAAREGVLIHTQHSSAVKEHGPLGNGWEVFSVEQRVGGTRRPDAVYVNHQQKRIFVEDLYTGSKKETQTATGPESAVHYRKGWNYAGEPRIQELVQQGYTFEYGVAPFRLQH
jgi:hypothetical protein